ncbi:hypothetical protein BH24ACT1_BH24ACT1_12350 [soil metagenome]
MSPALPDGIEHQTPVPGGIRLGLGANAGAFAVLVGVNALVGVTVGQERTVMPLLAERVFSLDAYTAAVSFILAFGAAKAATNFVAGALADRWGRKPVLVAGWIVGLPVAPLIIWAPSWSWIVAANALLGINQGLTWSMTVVMKIDLVGPARRGLALGLNEASGYLAVAITALATGAIAGQWGLRPEPFLAGICAVGIGLGISTLFVGETRGHADLEAATHRPATPGMEQLTSRQVFGLTSFREPALSAGCQAGMVNNAVDGMAWGLFPLLFAAEGLGVAAIGTLAAIYPATWGVGQLLTGALSDRTGRKPLIVGGMLVQAGALALMAETSTFAPWAVGATLLGLGTAMVYPTLLAVMGDVAHPAWRASAIGSYRLWRDSGYVVGGLLGGVVADLLGLRAGVWALALLSAYSGVVVLRRMYETRPPAVVHRRDRRTQDGEDRRRQDGRLEPLDDQSDTVDRLRRGCAGRGYESENDVSDRQHSRHDPCRDDRRSTGPRPQGAGQGELGQRTDQEDHAGAETCVEVCGREGEVQEAGHTGAGSHERGERR